MFQRVKRSSRVVRVLLDIADIASPLRSFFLCTFEQIYLDGASGASARISGNVDFAKTYVSVMLV
jgi:hypothetical protein